MIMKNVCVYFILLPLVNTMSVASGDSGVKIRTYAWFLNKIRLMSFEP